MKSIRNSFYKNLTFDNLLRAYKLSIIGKSCKEEVLVFSLDLEINLINLISDIGMFKYKIGSYKSFVIYEPKKRIIRCLPFVDRVVQTWYVECFIKPYFVPRFIYDSYACICGKGTHKAVFRLQYFMNCMRSRYDFYYVIKFDISKFFDSIDKDILFSLMKRRISDKYLLKFTYDLIYSYEYPGLQIGNYSSQYFANIYLNELDYFVKYDLGVKYYVRYMDDFIILVSDKKSAKEVYDLVERFLFDKLCLKLNPKSRYFPNKEGCLFLGYNVFEDYILIKNSNKKKIYKKIRVWNKLYVSGLLDKKKFDLSYNSYVGYIKHANSYGLKKDIDSKIMFD